MKLKYLAYGMATYLPGVQRLFGFRAGGTDSAEYCYSVWLRHLVLAHKSNLSFEPKIVAELGPGDSLGTGIAALISGSQRYVALDVVKYASTESNVEIFDGLVEMFRKKLPIPGDDLFPNVKPKLETYDFPQAILNDDRMQAALQDSRLQKIRHSILNPDSSESLIQYRVPWDARENVEEASVDMIYSQAVLEHVDDLPNTYRAMRQWVKPTGFVSHQIDFKSHSTAKQWNGHWKYSDWVWAVIRGRRPYLLNRQPHSAHITFLQDAGFNVVRDDRNESASVLQRSELARRFRSLTDQDLVTSGAFIQALPACQ